MSIRDFASKSILLERTIYNHIKYADSSMYEIVIFCNDKYIPAALNKELLKA